MSDESERKEVELRPLPKDTYELAEERAGEINVGEELDKRLGKYAAISREAPEKGTDTVRSRYTFRFLSYGAELSVEEVRNLNGKTIEVKAEATYAKDTPETGRIDDLIKESGLYLSSTKRW